MDGGDDLCTRIGKQDRHAVRHADAERRTRRVGDESIAFKGGRRVNAVPAHRAVHHAHLGGMDLRHHNQRVRVHRKRLAEALNVLLHDDILVPAVKPGIERCGMRRL